MGMTIALFFGGGGGMGNKLEIICMEGQGHIAFDLIFYRSTYHAEGSCIH